MADLNPLIRVRKHEVEQKQKFLAELYRQAEELENQKTTLLDQLSQERQNIKDMELNEAEALAYFGRYSKAVNERVADIDDAIGKLETRIEIAREDMRGAFAELKKIEITQENREEAEEAELERKEAALLDEMAIDSYRRQKDKS